MNCCDRNSVLPSWIAACLLATLLFQSIPLVAAPPVRLTQDGERKLAPAFIDGGKSIVFSVHDEPNRVTLVKRRLSDGFQERLDSQLTAHQFDADMSADGRFVCFALTYTSPQSVLVIRDLKDGSESRFIPTDARGTVRHPRFSP